MSREKNEGFMMHCKSVMNNFLTVLGLIVEPSTEIAKPKGSIQESLSIRKHPIGVTSSNNVISPSLSSFFFFRSRLISNSRRHQIIG